MTTVYVPLDVLKQMQEMEAKTRDHIHIVILCDGSGYVEQENISSGESWIADSADFDSPAGIPAAVNRLHERLCR